MNAINTAQAMNPEETFCSAKIGSDEGSVALNCQDGWNSVAWKGDDDGHASKRICRTNLDGETLTGRCLDIEEEEDISGETPVMKIGAVKAAKLQSTTWEGFLFKLPEINTRSDGVTVTTLYKSGETSVGESLIPAAIKSSPEGSPTVIFNITSGGPGNGDRCSFANTAPTCSPDGEDQAGEKEGESEVVGGPVSGGPQVEIELMESSQCQISGDALGTCTVSIVISSDDFVDKKIIREVAVKNLQTATWEGFQDSEGEIQSWIKAAETADPAALATPAGTVEQQFSLREFASDGGPLTSDCTVDADTGVITANATVVNLWDCAMLPCL